MCLVVSSKIMKYLSRVIVLVAIMGKGCIHTLRVNECLLREEGESRNPQDGNSRYICSFRVIEEGLLLRFYDRMIGSRWKGTCMYERYIVGGHD